MSDTTTPPHPSQLESFRKRLADILNQPFESEDLRPLGEMMALHEDMLGLFKALDLPLFAEGIKTLDRFVQEITFQNVPFQTGMSYVLNYHEFFDAQLARYLTGATAFDNLADKTHRFQAMFGFEVEEKTKTSGAAADGSAVIQVISDEYDDEGLISEFLSETNEGLESAEALLLELEDDLSKRDLVHPLFRTMHTLKGNAASFQLTTVSFLAHHMEDLLVGIRDGARDFTPAIFEAFFATIDVLHKLMDQLQTIFENGDPQPVNVQQAHDLLERVLADPNTTPGPTTKAAPKVAVQGAQTLAPNTAQTPNTAQADTSTERKTDTGSGERGTRAKGGKLLDMIKVPSHKLDELGELIGEMVVALSVLSQNPVIEAIVDREARERLDQLDKVTESLRERILGIRMFPVGTVFSKLNRQVRDLSFKSGKKIDFQLEGADTLVDKSVIDVIYAPLMHLVRNAIDHGLEDEAGRRAAGKPLTGQVRLTATHRGDSIVIEITDDGKGLNRQAVYDKAVTKGLVKEGEQLTDQQVYALIFTAGFSTAKTITDVSGRGVGLDVVKKSIETLRGRIQLDSEPGRGTTFTIKLPLTTSIIEGLVVRIGDSLFVVPILDVSVTATPKPDELKGIQGRDGEFFLNAGDLVPIIRLYQVLDLQPRITDPCKAIMIIINEGKKKYGLMVDELLHRQQVVIKKLGSRFHTHRAISGGTILGNGRVGFILEPHELLHNR